MEFVRKGKRSALVSTAAMDKVGLALNAKHLFLVCRKCVLCMETGVDPVVAHFEKFHPKESVQDGARQAWEDAMSLLAASADRVSDPLDADDRGLTRPALEGLPIYSVHFCPYCTHCQDSADGVRAHIAAEHPEREVDGFLPRVEVQLADSGQRCRPFLVDSEKPTGKVEDGLDGAGSDADDDRRSDDDRDDERPVRRRAQDMAFCLYSEDSVLKSRNHLRSQALAVNTTFNLLVCTLCGVNLDFEAAGIQRHLLETHHVVGKSVAPILAAALELRVQKPQPLPGLDRSSLNPFAPVEGLRIHFGDRCPFCDFALMRPQKTVRTLKEHLEAVHDGNGLGFQFDPVPFQVLTKGKKEACFPVRLERDALRLTQAIRSQVAGGDGRPPSATATAGAHDAAAAGGGGRENGSDHGDARRRPSGYEGLDLREIRQYERSLINAARLPSDAAPLPELAWRNKYDSKLMSTPLLRAYAMAVNVRYNALVCLQCGIRLGSPREILEHETSFAHRREQKKVPVERIDADARQLMDAKSRPLPRFVPLADADPIAPVEGLRIQFGWTCRRCRKDFVGFRRRADCVKHLKRAHNISTPTEQYCSYEGFQTPMLNASESAFVVDLRLVERWRPQQAYPVRGGGAPRRGRGRSEGDAEDARSSGRGKFASRRETGGDSDGSSDRDYYSQRVEYQVANGRRGPPPRGVGRSGDRAHDDEEDRFRGRGRRRGGRRPHDAKRPRRKAPILAPDYEKFRQGAKHPHRPSDDHYDSATGSAGNAGASSSSSSSTASASSSSSSSLSMDGKGKQGPGRKRKSSVGASLADYEAECGAPTLLPPAPAPAAKGKTGWRASAESSAGKGPAPRESSLKSENRMDRAETSQSLLSRPPPSVPTSLLTRLPILPPQNLFVPPLPPRPSSPVPASSTTLRSSPPPADPAVMPIVDMVGVPGSNSDQEAEVETPEQETMSVDGRELDDEIQKAREVDMDEVIVLD